MAEDGETYVDWSVNDMITRETVLVANPETTPELNTGYIRVIMEFENPGSDEGIIDYGKYVISVSTDQGTSEQEGDMTAKMTVTLHNHNNFFINKFVPQATLVYSWIEEERNIVQSSGNIEVIYERYPLFFGRVQEINPDNEICTIECGDESSTMEASLEFDWTWYPTTTLKERFQDILDSTDPPTRLKMSDGDPYFKVAKELELEWKTCTEDSGKSCLTSNARSIGVDWENPSDQMFRLIIMDHDGYRAGGTDPDLTEHTLIPGDNASIVGHCNEVTVEYTNLEEPTHKSKSIQKSSLERVVKDNPDSKEKYGTLDAKLFRMPWITKKEQAEQFAENIIDIYTEYQDRLITPTIVDTIPMLNSYMHYRIVGNISGIYPGEEAIDHYIYTKVLRKKVTYDSGGVVSQLECVRKEQEAVPGAEVPDDHQRLDMTDTTIGGIKLSRILLDISSDGFVNYLITDGLTEQQISDYLVHEIYPPGDWYPFTGTLPDGRRVIDGVIQ